VITAYEVMDEQRLAEGGFLSIRRLRLRLRRADGTLTKEGVYDFVERPMGLDAAVVALWHRDPAGVVQVLVRRGLRVPIDFGRPDADRMPHRFTELVAGILEEGEHGEAALRKRAAAEALEEAGLDVDADSVTRLGPPMFPTPGLFAELFHFVACEVRDPSAARVPEGDGSPFEEGASLAWLPLEDALGACARGEITDLKTELALRRLADYLASR
jgi:ADP-ribose pyrophosphatase